MCNTNRPPVIVTLLYVVFANINIIYNDNGKHFDRAEFKNRQNKKSASYDVPLCRRWCLSKPGQRNPPFI